jgi:hypothetical protein
MTERPYLLQLLYTIAPAAATCRCGPSLCPRCRQAVLLLPLVLRQPRRSEPVISLRITGRVVPVAALALPMVSTPLPLPTLSELAEDPP